MSPPPATAPETFCDAKRHESPVPSVRWTDVVRMNLCNACYMKVNRETKAKGTGPEVLADLREWLKGESGLERGRNVRLKGTPQMTPENAELLDRMAAERETSQYGYVSELIEEICALRRALELGDSKLVAKAQARIRGMAAVMPPRGNR
jgi:hypothetical protein